MKASVRSCRDACPEALGTGPQNGRKFPERTGLLERKASTTHTAYPMHSFFFRLPNESVIDWFCFLVGFDVLSAPLFLLLQEANSMNAGIKLWNIHRNVSGAASEKDLFVLLGCVVPSDWMLAKLSVLWNKFPNPLGPELCSAWDGKEITFNRKLIAKI